MRGARKAASVWQPESYQTGDASLTRKISVQRLKTRSQFETVLAGQRVASTVHFVLHRCGLGGTLEPGKSGQNGSQLGRPSFARQVPWVGAMVPKRWAKRAVTRNTIKRQIHSVSSEFESSFLVAAHVVRLRAGFDRDKFVSAGSPALKQAVRQELEELFKHANRGTVGMVPLSGEAR